MKKKTDGPTPRVTTTRRVELTFPHGEKSMYSGCWMPRTYYLSSTEARILAAELTVGADAIDKAMP